jgi:hypothetical protein
MTWTWRDWRWRGAGLWCLALGVAAPASAQVIITLQPDTATRAELPAAAELESVQINPDVRDLAKRLDSDSYAEREEATRALMEAAFDRLQIYALLERESLAPEQRHRLLEVLRHGLINTPRGALGISMPPRRPPGENPIDIEVFGLVPGMPAERVLQLGDRIALVDGAELWEHDDLVRRVQSKRPGDTVRLLVRRPRRDDSGALRRDAQDRPIYDEIEVDLTLGSTEMLAIADDPNRNVARSSFVQVMEEEAALALQVYGRVAARVEIRGESAGAFAGTTDPLLQALDLHPAIQTLLALLQDMEQLTPRQAEDVRRACQRTLRQLEQEASLPDVEPQQQAFLRRVAQRYRELLREAE